MRRIGQQPTVTMAFAIEPTDRDALMALAREQGCTVSSLVRDTLLSALAKHERKAEKAKRTAAQANATEAVA